MRLGYIILYVEDVVTTVAFYEKAFGLKCRFIHESNTYAEMETGQTALAFVSETTAKESLPFQVNRIKKEAAGIEIGFVVENVAQQYNHAVESSAIPVVKPTKKPWGQTVSYVRDNNGCLVEIW
jgi:lactoylglutathione lyase